MLLGELEVPVSRRHHHFKVGYNMHHRKPKAQRGKNTKENMVEVPIIKHRYWTLLFDGTRTVHSICDEINHVWLDPAFCFICVPTSKYEKAKQAISQLT
jgi:hypothetical protein